MNSISTTRRSQLTMDGPVRKCGLPWRAARLPRLALLLLILGFAGSAATLPAQTPPPSSGGGLGSLPDTHILIVPIDEIDLPAQEAGVIVELDVRMGTQVKKGQIIGRVNDKDAQARLKAAMAELQMARVQAESDASVQEALAMVEIADAEYNNSKQINSENAGAVSLFELRRLEATAKRAHFRAEIAQVDQQVAKLTVQGKAAQVERLQAELERRQIVAPISGVVVRRFRDAGEWVSAGDPVVRLLRMDRLRAEAMVNAEDYTPAELIGQRIKLVVTIKRGVEREVVAQITHVSPEVDSGGYFYAHAEFDNPVENGQWVIRPGLKARAEPLDDSAAPAVPRR